MTDPCILFLETADRQPTHPAVIQEGRIVSYGEMRSLAARIAGALVRVRKSPRVLIYLPKSAEAYCSMFGVLMAGGYYSPINMDAPKHKHVEIFRQLIPDVVISTKDLVNALPIAESKTSFVDVEALPDTKLIEPLSVHQLAYIFFTSGSTGKPKGVMIPRAGLAHYVEWAIRAMNVSSQDRWSQHPNIGFDLSVLDIFGALCGGATLFPLTSKKDKLLPAAFIKRNKLTIWNSVPSVIDLMTRARQVSEENFDSLRLMTFCGEPLFLRHLEAIFSAKNNMIVHNTYGPTEATVSCTVIELTRQNYRSLCHSSAPLGKPIPGMEMILLGDSKAEGEIVLVGAQLAIGYWHDRDTTDKSFFMQNTERRAYRTGDWATIKQGEYYFSGRTDHQVKIRGNRVELDEIDAAIHRLGYGDSCTIYTGEQLHCFIEASQLPSIFEFRERLSSVLPEYAIPQHLHTIDKLPLNANDKIDRKRLAELAE